MRDRRIILTISLWLTIFMGYSGPSFAAACSYPDLFEEITRVVEKDFYDPVRIQRDFAAIKNKYLCRLGQISGKKEFAGLVNAMLGELKASHTYYLTREDYEYYHLAALFSNIPEVGALFREKEVRYPTIGVITQTFQKRVHVVSVLAGSIAEKAGLLKGDEILSVNKAPYTPIACLSPLVGMEVPFVIRRKEKGEPFKIMMKPALVDPKQEMLDAEKASIRMIKQGGKQIGYIHIYSYAGEEYHRELLNALVWGSLKKADGLIIDLRYGLGGAWPYYLNLFNRKIPVLEMIDREGKKSIVDSQWRKPAVYLVNGFSRSGKEMLAFGAKKYGLATVIGEKTPGHTLGGRLFPLSNKDLLFLAVQSCRIDGVNLEGTGVEPDIKVRLEVPYCSGQDTQLKKAIEHLMDELSKESHSVR
ncbi:S41 family peptidase [Desulfospira joergensenii]|uniref:S41 family peptidase n=1 Tax=Desulfospira joergensenii TaxID=53329 RepID=UPI0003B36949|nr:S41 family peptidase [Desulfospira joergensenii]